MFNVAKYEFFRQFVAELGVYEHHEHGTSVSLKFAVNQMCRSFLSVTKCLN